jgi:hypothetical protein
MSASNADRSRSIRHEAKQGGQVMTERGDSDVP